MHTDRMYSVRMTIEVVSAAHVRVTCDGCKAASAELCGRRELEVFARTEAVPKFRKAGWHHDPGSRGRRERTIASAEADGSGRWYCPECAKRTHL